MFSGSFSRSDFGHVFGRPSVAKRLQIGGQNRGQICQKVNKKRGRIPITFFYGFFIDFWGSGPWKSMQNAWEVLQKSRNWPARKYDAKSHRKWRENAPKTMPESLKRVSKKRIKNCVRFFFDFCRVWPPKRGTKKWLNSLFEVPFRVLGAIWLQKGSVGRSDPIFEAFLMILDRFLRKMFNFF